MPQALYILLGAALTVASAVALGSLILKWLRLSLSPEENTLFSFLTGAAGLSALVFLLCAAGIVYKGVLLALAVMLIALGRQGLRTAKLPRIGLPWWAVYGAFGVLYITNAMAPEHSPDGMTYHLGLVARYYREHGFHRIATNMYANLSQGVEMLFLLAFAVGRHSAAAMVHAAFLFATPLLFVSFGTRFGVRKPALAAGLIFFVTPVVGIDGVSAYNDVAAACVLFALFYILQIWDQDRQGNLLAVSGILAGFAYCIKYTAGFGALYAVLFVLFRARKIKPALQIAAVSAMLMAPWVIKNIIFVGNPVAPFANKWFPNPQLTPAFEKEYSNDMRHFNGVPDSAVPIGVTIRGELLGGVIGPVFLLLPLVFLPGATSLRTRVLIAAAVFSIPFAFNIGTRFLIPSLPFWSLALALAFSRIPFALSALIVVHALLSWPSILTRYCEPHAWRLQKITWREALRIVPEEKVLYQAARTYLLARMVETHVPPGQTVFTFGAAIAEAYTSRPIIVGIQSWPGQKLRDLIYAALNPDFSPTWGLTFRFSPQPIHKLRVEQTNSHYLDVWSISEMRLFHGDKELERAPTWRLRTHPNPWDVQNAFDNSPVTRWSAGEQIHRGMFVEVDLGASTQLDSVRLECTRDQYQIRLKLEAPDNNGQWRVISDVPDETQLPSPGGMRRAAIEELKMGGVRYLLVDKDDYGAIDFVARQPQWGIRLLDEKDQARLYILE